MIRKASNFDIYSIINIYNKKKFDNMTDDVKYDQKYFESHIPNNINVYEIDTNVVGGLLPSI